MVKDVEIKKHTNLTKDKQVKTLSHTKGDSFKRKSKDIWNKVLDGLQNLGKSLQFPIAVLPFAAILNRFGALGIAYTSNVDASGVLHITNAAGYWVSYVIQTPGAIVFANLALFFAIGVGFGLAKDKRGEAALASVAFFLVTVAFTSEHGLPSLVYDSIFNGSTQYGFYDSSGKWYCDLYYSPVLSGTVKTGATYVLDIGVVGGIVAGAFTAYFYNKFCDIKLPQTLAFFGGRRFVPMLAILVAIPISFGYALVWPWIQMGLVLFGSSISGTGAGAIAGVFGFGVLNRLLLPFGLHQILNTFLWFQLPITGEKIAPFSGVVDPTGSHTINGDINAFTGGIFGSGNFQTGFFPIMMGGLPAAVIAMIFAAKKENRISVSGFLGGTALVSFLTGITEPIEFSFVFIAPLLLVVHAFLTGIFNAAAIAMHMHIGFGFSAGVIDYLISFAQSWGFSVHEHAVNGSVYGVLSNPLWMLALTALAAVTYYFVFFYMIKGLNIKTPGREDDYVAGDYDNEVKKDKKGKKDKSKETDKSDKMSKSSKLDTKYAKMAEEIIAAIGASNIENVDNCATRLRLTLKDNTLGIDDKRIKATGIYGIKRLGKKSLQIIVGGDVEHVASAMKKLL